MSTNYTRMRGWLVYLSQGIFRTEPSDVCTYGTRESKWHPATGEAGGVNKYQFISSLISLVSTISKTTRSREPVIKHKT